MISIHQNENTPPIIKRRTGVGFQNKTGSGKNGVTITGKLPKKTEIGESRKQLIDDDEDIIELVEEIGEESPEHALSDLERNLLDLDDKGHTADRSLPELPDISDLSLIDFEEEETEAPGEGPPPAEAGTEGASLTADAARLFEPDAEGDSAAAEKRPAAPLDEIEEISEFDEQFLEADELLEGLPAPPE